MSATSTKKNHIIPITIIAGLFFILGFVTWINGALIPFMKTINELTVAQSYFVASASYISFVVMALPASFIINKIGYRKGMSLGLMIMAVGALVFIPAAEARTYWIFLTGIFIQGMGMTLLQTAINPYITILGPIESAAKRILLSGIDDIQERLSSVGELEKDTMLNTMADSVVIPYIVMAIVLVVLGVLIRRAPLPHVEAEPIKESKDGETAKTSIFQFPHLWLGVLTLFVYVGVEVIAGDTIIAYGISLGIPVEQAKYFTMYTMFAMVFAYGLGVFLIPKYINQALALRASAALGVVFTFFIVFTSGLTSVLFVAALGIANALVWPAVWPLTLEGLGKFTKTASALLIMAISGGAIIPPLYGRFVDGNRAGLIAEGMSEAAATAEASTSGYWILLPCYLIILYYAISGHKLGLNKK